MKNREPKLNLALARRIRAAGAAIYIEEDDGETPQIHPTGLRIRQTGGVIESRAFDFYGSTGYILRVAITFKLPNFAISSFDLELPYKSVVNWLDDPIEYGEDRPVYRFRGNSPLRFDRELVLNHYADVRRTFSYGQSVEGSLLGIGMDPMPDDFQHGQRISAFLVVWGQFGGQYRSPVSLWADRGDKSSPRNAPWKPRRGRLHDRRDPSSGPCIGEKEVNVEPKK